MMASVKFRAKIAKMGDKQLIVIPKSLRAMTSELSNKRLLVEIKEDILYE